MLTIAQFDRLLKQLIADRAKVAPGMGRVIELLRGIRTPVPIQKLEAIDWDSHTSAVRRWLARCGRALPPAPEVVSFWMPAPAIDLNSAVTWIIGGRSFDPMNKSGDWACDTFWPTEQAERDGLKKANRRAIEEGSYFMLSPLDRARRMLKVGPGFEHDPKRLESLRFCLYALPLAYTGLLVVNAMPAAEKELLRGSEGWRGVGFGFQEGDTSLAGVLTASGWVKPEKRHARRFIEAVPKADENPKLDINSEEFDCRAYVRSGLDINVRDRHGYSPLLKCSGPFDKNYPLLREILKKKPDVSARTDSGGTALLFYSGAPVDIVRTLLKLGADPNAANDIGYTPLLSACARSKLNVENIRLLLEAGADPNPTRCSQGALHRMAEAGMPWFLHNHGRIVKAVQLLLEHGAKLETRDERGFTPLMVALYTSAEYAASEKPGESYGHDRFAMLLLKHGANPNVVFKESPHPRIPAGGTALMVQRYGDGALHLALLKAGADARKRCKKGKTAQEYAAAAMKKARGEEKRGIERVVEAIAKGMKNTKNL